MFKDGLDIPEIPNDIEILAESISIGNESRNCDSPLKASYSSQGSVIFDLGSFFDDSNWSDAFKIINKSISVRLSSGLEIPLIVIKADFSQKPRVTAVPTSIPIIIGGDAKATSADAYLLSPPELLTNSVSLLDSNGTNIEINRISQSSEICKISFEGEFSAKEFHVQVGPFLTFLTFMKGSYCGLGHVKGLKNDGTKAFELIGFTNRDHVRKTNWFDIGIQSELPEIYGLFSEKQRNKAAQIAFKQTIEFYRAANALRDVSLHTAIIASQTALEALVNYILENKAGWSKNLLGVRQLKFSDKFRAAAAHFNIDTDVLKFSPELTKFQERHNEFDVYEMIPYFRNKLVHQDVKHPPTGIQLHEIWQIAQWLVEVLIFAIIGYKGEIIDRRPYGNNAWRGTKCQLPYT